MPNCRWTFIFSNPALLPAKFHISGNHSCSPNFGADGREREFSFVPLMPFYNWPAQFTLFDFYALKLVSRILKFITILFLCLSLLLATSPTADLSELLPFIIIFIWFLFWLLFHHEMKWIVNKISIWDTIDLNGYLTGNI